MMMVSRSISGLIRVGSLVIIEDGKTISVTRENAMDVVDGIMEGYHSKELTWPKLVSELDALVDYLS